MLKPRRIPGTRKPNARSRKVPSAIAGLTEILAGQAHRFSVDASAREGRIYSRSRDGMSRRHSGPAAYEDLPEPAKEHHRNTAREIIHTILSEGYRIERCNIPSGLSLPVPAGESGGISALLADPDVDLTALLAFWRTRDESGWLPDQGEVRSFAERLLKLGQPLVAYDVLRESLQHWPADARLRQLLALALLRGGATERAFTILQKLRSEGVADEETLGMLARIYKDRALRSLDPRRKRYHFQLAYKLYAEAYRKTGGYWTGINAATIASLLDLEDRSTKLARSVRNRCLRLLKQAPDNQERFWLLASLGECALVLGDWSEAADYYSRAGDMGRGWYGDLSSTRRNARLLLEHLGDGQVPIDRCLRIPRVAVFAGHMIDAPHRSPPRFPPELEGPVFEEIRAALEQEDCRIGFSSAACGSDILFLEAVLKAGGEAHIVLPCDTELFRKSSVEVVPGLDWSSRFARVLERATEVLSVSPQKSSAGGALYEYANLMLYGLAAIRADQLETALVPLAVWDGGQDGGPGGTADSVKRWVNLGHEVRTIDLAGILRENQAAVRTRRPSPRRPRARSAGASPESAMRIIAVLFADVVQYTRLTEEEVPRFVGHFLGMVSELMANSGNAPEIKNTWGDGLFFAFSSVRAAGLFALDLSERVMATDWAEKGLPAELNIRIALHAGPVYPCFDPVTGQDTYMGSHVSRAARIEPITPPGMVYASQAFAALASAEHAKEFKCEYVGQTPLAKGYGTFPTFHVRRCAE